MNVKVKICGIRTIEAALAAVRAGADFLGFNFVQSSRRYITPQEAREIIGQLGSHVKVVGVFQNEKIEEVKRIVEYLRLDFVQLHGEEPKEYCSELTQYAGVIKVFQIEQRSETEKMIETMKQYDVDYYLLDREIQGEGEMVDWEKAKIISRKLPIFLAGGLTLENVSEAVKTVKPFAVDVTGGIETGGQDDVEKISEFISQVRGSLL